MNEKSLRDVLNVARKNDGDKDPWHLAPWDAFRAIVTILKSGAKKYEPRNWEKGMAWSRCYSALMRHMTAWWEGESCDAETGDSHLWHAGCCLVFLIAYELRGIGTDDRPNTMTLTGRDYVDAAMMLATRATVIAEAERIVPRSHHVYVPFPNEYPPWVIQEVMPLLDPRQRWYKSIGNDLYVLEPWVSFSGKDGDRPPPNLDGYYTFANFPEIRGWLLEISNCPSEIRDRWEMYLDDRTEAQYRELLTWERGFYERKGDRYLLKLTLKSWANQGE